MSDIFVYLDNVQYTPRDWENRNKVKTSNGPIWMTIPVKAEYLALIPDVTIDNTQKWQKKHLQILRHSYGKAPYFKEWEEPLRLIYEEAALTHLMDLNIALTDFLLDAFNLKKPKIVRASQLEVSSTGSDLLLDICKAVGGTTYLSGPHGREYIKKDTFVAENITLQWHEYDHPKYPQLHGGFVGNLAALDLLFNCGPDGREILLTSSTKRIEV